MIECQICHKQYKSIKGLSSHIRQTHKISSEEYYIRYINSNHSCKLCGNPTGFINLSYGFHIYCSYVCLNNDKEKINQQINKFKSNPQNIEQARHNIIQYNQSDIGRQNSSKVGKITGGISFKNSHKKYDGIKWCDDCKENTMHVLGIGCMTCYNRSESHKNNIINSIQNKYGDEYINVFQVPEIKEKIIQTSLLRYNTTNPGNSIAARQKANITMKKNGTMSSIESYLANILDNLHINYIMQYKSIKYPYFCDFYLPDTDTYIELNIYWSHGKHWFDNTNKNDIDILNIWIDKANNGNKHYQNAINVWTKSDLEKRDTAIKNNLNYVVLWNKQDIDEYINKLRAI